MDRFIGTERHSLIFLYIYLKSNMDRFIETHIQIVDVNVFI